MKIVLILIIAVAVGYLLFQFYKSTPMQSAGQKSTTKPKHITVLVSSDTQLPSVLGVKEGLKSLGYSEGQNLILEVKNPKGDRELTKKMAQDMVASNPDLLVPMSTTATKAIQEAAKETFIPIVFVDVGNFKELGITDSKHPGGLITGIVKDNVNIGAKRMEILKEIIPQASVFGIFVNPKHVSFDEIKQVHESAAQTLGLQLKEYSVTNEVELKAAVTQVVRDHPDGFLTVPDTLVTSNASLIAPALAQAKIPTIDVNAEQGIKVGYLLVYGVYRFDVGKQGARIIDKVLKGESPGNIPVEFASDLKLQINGEVAKEMGIEVPASIRIRTQMNR